MIYYIITNYDYDILYYLILYNLNVHLKYRHKYLCVPRIIYYVS